MKSRRSRAGAGLQGQRRTALMLQVSSGGPGLAEGHRHPQMWVPVRGLLGPVSIPAVPMRVEDRAAGAPQAGQGYTALPQGCLSGARILQNRVW